MNLDRSPKDVIGMIVQQLLGHKDGRMTQRYAHLKIKTLRNAVESLEGGRKKGHSLSTTSPNDLYGYGNYILCKSEISIF